MTDLNRLITSLKRRAAHAKEFGHDVLFVKIEDIDALVEGLEKAQPSPEYPETLPCPVLLEPGMRFGKGVKTRLVLEAIQRRAEHYAELEAMTPEERAEYDAGIEAFKAMLPQPAPASVPGFSALTKCIVQRLVDYGTADDDAIASAEEFVYNACRAAMIEAAPQEVKPWSSHYLPVTRGDAVGCPFNREVKGE
ncbi:TPA: hypothetical protein MYT95_003189 [Klebsiella aerogenes]|nr:hypothetical protein [Klebsiella aerogenes]HCM1666603.1 hypothetical protein [Klebsiella aerogenes]